MPKATIDSERGVNQTAGEGLSVTGMPITYSTSSTALVHNDEIPAEVQVVKVTVNNTVAVKLANPSSTATEGIGTVKVIVVEAATGSPVLQIKNKVGNSNVNSLSGGAVPGTVETGDSFVCVYVKANKWTLLQ